MSQPGRCDMTDPRSRTPQVCCLAAAIIGSLCIGCAPPSAEQMAHLPAAELAVKLKDDNPIVRRRAATALGLRGEPRGVPSLLDATADPDPQVRAAAAAALGRLDDLRALWPLVQLAARDRDPRVQEAALGAILSLGPEEDARTLGVVRERLVRKVTKVALTDAPLWDVVRFLGDVSGMGYEIHFGDLVAAGIDRDHRISLRGSDVPLGVLACRMLVACKPKEPVGFLWCPPLTYSTVEGFAKAKAGSRRAKRRQRARARYCQTGRANRETWDKLSRRIPKVYFTDEELAKAVERLSRAGGVRIQVDWPTLRECGIDPTTEVNIHLTGASGRTALRVLADDVGAGGTTIDWLIVDGAVVLSTAKAIDKRMGFKE